VGLTSSRPRRIPLPISRTTPSGSLTFQILPTSPSSPKNSPHRTIAARATGPCAPPSTMARSISPASAETGGSTVECMASDERRSERSDGTWREGRERSRREGRRVRTLWDSRPARSSLSEAWMRDSRWSIVYLVFLR
jgi:hypothetical protein